MQCTCFNDEVDTFEPLFEVDKVYELSKFSLKAGNKKYTNNRWEMTLSRQSRIFFFLFFICNNYKESIPLKGELISRLIVRTISEIFLN